MASMMVALRWDGPHLSRQELMARAAKATQEVSDAFDHVDQLDIKAMPDEQGQYVQLIINTSASEAESQRMSRMLKSEFGDTSSKAVGTATQGTATRRPGTSGGGAEEGRPISHYVRMLLLIILLIAAISLGVWWEMRSHR